MHISTQKDETRERQTTAVIGQPTLCLIGMERQSILLFNSSMFVLLFSSDDLVYVHTMLDLLASEMLYQTFSMVSASQDESRV